MEDRLYIKLFQLRRRQALVQGIHRCLQAGLWGGWLCLPLLLLFTALRLPPQNQLQALWVWPLLAGAGFMHGLLLPMSLRQVAHQADRLNGLQERLLTCLAHLESRRPNSVVSQMLLQETVERLDGLDPQRTFPARWRRPLLRWLVPALGLVAVFTLTPLLLPPPPVDPLQQEVLASRQRLNRLAQRLAASRPHSRQHQQLQKLMRKMPQQVPAQAARQLRSTLAELQRQMAEQKAQARQLDQIAKGPAGAAQRQQLEELRKQLLEQPQAQNLLDQAQKALQQGQQQSAQKAMREAQKQLLGGDQIEQQQQLSQALQDELGQLAPQQGTGQDQPGEGGLPGQGSPKPGKGKGGADFGVGSTNQEQKSGDPAQPKRRDLRQNPQQSHKTEQFRQLYGSDRKHLETRRERVAMAGAKGKLLRMSDSQLGESRLDDPSLRPEQADFLEAKALAEQSVAEERIPTEHREAVRRYFDQIDPRH